MCIWTLQTANHSLTKHDLIPQCRAWARMHSHVHYALACSTVFTLDYSCEGLEFGRET